MSENRDLDAFYRRQDNERMRESVRAKAERGQRLSDREHEAVANEYVDKIYGVIRKCMAEAQAKPGRTHQVLYSQGTHDGIYDAIRLLLVAMETTRISHVRARERMEDRLLDRIAALESRLSALEDGRQEVIPPVRLVR
jgi:hypothetical protein